MLETLGAKKLYMKHEKCSFQVEKAVLLVYVVSKDGVSVDQSKIKAINSWPIPTNISEVRTFYGLSSFYRRFIRDFSSIIGPNGEFMVQDAFVLQNMQSVSY